MIAFLLLLAALVVFALAAAGVAHHRIALVPLGLALATLALALRWWPPP